LPKRGCSIPKHNVLAPGGSQRRRPPTLVALPLAMLFSSCHKVGLALGGGARRTPLRHAHRVSLPSPTTRRAAPRTVHQIAVADAPPVNNKPLDEPLDPPTQRSQVKPRVAYHKLHCTPLNNNIKVLPRPKRDGVLENLSCTRPKKAPVNLAASDDNERGVATARVSGFFLCRWPGGAVAAADPRPRPNC
jgi:hypothetical protein